MRRSTSMRGLLLAATMGLGLLLGCDDEPVQPAGHQAQGAQSTAPAAAKEEEAAPAAAPAEDYIYNPIGKRDPFRPFFRSVDTTILEPTPLQKFDVDQYKLVGVVWGVAVPRAMVEDPEKVGHVIEVGTYIGKNWGRVTEINAETVVVTEEYNSINGELVTNKLEMRLNVSGEGQKK